MSIVCCAPSLMYYMHVYVLYMYDCRFVISRRALSSFVSFGLLHGFDFIIHFILFFFFLLKNHSTLDKYPSLSSTIFFEHTNNKLIVRMRKEKRKKPLGKWNFILVGNFACFRYTGITMSMAVIAFALNLQIRVATSS